MWYIINTESWICVAKFPDDQWEEATKELRRLRKRNGDHFKLMDH